MHLHTLWMWTVRDKMLPLERLQKQKSQARAIQVSIEQEKHREGMLGKWVLLLEMDGEPWRAWWECFRSC